MNREIPPEDAEEDPEDDAPQKVVRYHLSFDSETIARLEELKKKLATLPKGCRIEISLPRHGKS